MSDEKTELDALVIGAGFAGIYALKNLRENGFTVKAVEAAAGVGGVWFWNRYPGARCDAQSLTYSYSGFAFPGVEQKWSWTETHAAQPEIEQYLNFVVDSFDLRRDIRFNTRVERARYLSECDRWDVDLGNGDSVLARNLVLAVGSYSEPVAPDIRGLDQFEGEIYFTSRWPDTPVDFAGKRVGVVGTGSSGCQVVTALSRRDNVQHVYVFQRTPNFAVPLRNEPMDPDFEREFKSRYEDFRKRQRGIGQSVTGGTSSYVASIHDAPTGPAIGQSEEAFHARMDAAWQIGGSSVFTSISDLYTEEEADARVTEYIRGRIRRVVNDPEVAETLSPRSHFLASRRTLCLDGYYEAFNQPNVTLVDVKKAPIVEVGPHTLQTSDADFDLDAIIFATGFDSMTGSILKLDIEGLDGMSLRGHWAQGPRTYLGLMTSGFPNLFNIVGPGSPSQRSQVVNSIEQHVEWMTDLLLHAKERDVSRVNATPEAEDAWTVHVAETAANSLVSRNPSQYMGSNVPGKPPVYQIYVGGPLRYRRMCEQVAERDYEGIEFTGDDGTVASDRQWRGLRETASADLGEVV